MSMTTFDNFDHINANTYYEHENNTDPIIYIYNKSIHIKRKML